MLSDDFSLGKKSEDIVKLGKVMDGRKCLGSWELGKELGW